MDILLIGGLWLDASAWNDVVPRLQELGHEPLPISLPGQGAPPPDATLDQQREAVAAAVASVDEPAMVVGHSAASTLAWMAADDQPDKVSRVVMIGGFPSLEGNAYADFFPFVDGTVPFPGWETFEGPDAADIDEQGRRDIGDRLLPVPEGVARGIVRYGDERRFEIPVTLICPEFSPSQAKEWLEKGEVAELPRVRGLDYVDIDSGHWPMFTRPRELADLLSEIASR